MIDLGARPGGKRVGKLFHDVYLYIARGIEKQSLFNPRAMGKLQQTGVKVGTSRREWNALI